MGDVENIFDRSNHKMNALIVRSVREKAAWLRTQPPSEIRRWAETAGYFRLMRDAFAEFVDVVDAAVDEP